LSATLSARSKILSPHTAKADEQSWHRGFELILKKLVNAALGGDPKSADDLFTLRTQAERNNGAKIEKIIVEDWVPDFPRQTGEQKTRAHARESEIDPTGFWEQTDSSATDPPGSVSPIASPKAPRDE
jgi:hypothetical protein